MKVELKPTITTQKTSFFTKVKKYISAKLKPLSKDAFEKGVNKAEKEVIVSRKYPNWCDGPDSGYRNNTIAKRICYYPEDEKIMETMTAKERWAYKDHLDRIGRFYYDDNYHVDTPELDKVMKKYGINIEDYIIKDNK